MTGEIAFPETEEEVRSVIKAAAAHGVGVRISGGREVVDARHLTLSTARLTEIEEHAAGDQTVTCGAGCTIAQLDTTIVTAQQRVALEPGRRSDATVGGVVASNSEGFIASRFGGVRDQVLGLTVVTAQGETATFGGRVVKNVTGYDVARLMCGSNGTLGVITSVTLRLRPIPVSSLTLTIDHDELASAFESALLLRDVATDISALAVFQHSAPGEDGWCVAVRYEGSPLSLEDAAEKARAAGRAKELSADDAETLWRTLTDAGHVSRHRHERRERPSNLVPAATHLVTGHGDAITDCILDVGHGRLIAVAECEIPDFVAPSPQARALTSRLVDHIDPDGVFTGARA